MTNRTYGELIRSSHVRFVLALGCAALIGTIATAVRPLWAENTHGKQVFEKRCTGCHALDNEKLGPHLRGVYGRTAGAVASFQYSEALKMSGITWDSSTLDKWLSDPDAFVPDNEMAFRITSPEDRAAIIGYLKEVSSK